MQSEAVRRAKRSSRGVEASLPPARRRKAEDFEFLSLLTGRRNKVATVLAELRGQFLQAPTIGIPLPSCLMCNQRDSVKQRSYGPFSWFALGRDVLPVLGNYERNWERAQGQMSQGFLRVWGLLGQAE